MDDFWHKNLFKNRIPHITGSFIKDFVSANLPIKATQAQGYKFFLCFLKIFISLGRLAEAKSLIKELVMWGILLKFLCQKSSIIYYSSRFSPYPFTMQGLGSMLKVMKSNPRWPPCDSVSANWMKVHLFPVSLWSAGMSYWKTVTWLWGWCLDSNRREGKGLG